MMRLRRLEWYHVNTKDTFEIGNGTRFLYCSKYEQQNYLKVNWIFEPEGRQLSGLQRVFRASWKIFPENLMSIQIVFTCTSRPPFCISVREQYNGGHVVSRRLWELVKTRKCQIKLTNIRPQMHFGTKSIYLKTVYLLHKGIHSYKFNRTNK